MSRTAVRTLPLAAGVGRDAISRFKKAGFYAHTVARITGLTKGQVMYRLKSYGLIVPRVFALGESEQARELIAGAKVLVARIEEAKRKAEEECKLRKFQMEQRYD